jgi:hypothetical protein
MASKPLMMSLDGVEHELDLDSMLISEARELKRLTGWDYLTWRSMLGQSDPDAIAFAWWMVCKRAGDPVPGSFMDLDFDMVSLQVRVVVDDEAADEQADDADDARPIGSVEGSETTST